MNMTQALSIIWRKLGSIQLTVALCMLLTADLAYGYICLNRRTILFAPLNDMGLAAWITTYGRHNLLYTVWFFILLGLLTMLCMNTFACTTDRVVGLIRARAHFSTQRFFFRFAPHVMHYAMIIILAGYLLSYLFAQVIAAQTLVPGASLTLPGTKTRITFTSFDPVYYQGDRLPSFHNRVIRPRAHLQLTDGDRERTALLSYNQSIWFKGYGIFLKDFAPKSTEGMSRKVRIDMSIRRDPGVRLYLTGMALFSVGLATYLAEWILFRKIKREIA